MLRNYIILLGLIAIFSCKNVEQSDKTTIEHHSVKAMAISLESIYVSTDEFILFLSKATRIRKVQGEYLPTSERFRVIVSDSSGREVWNSSRGKSYMQATQDVIPIEVSDTATFTQKWTFDKNHAKRGLPAMYQAVLMIPSNPEPYTDTLFINLQ